MACCDARRRPPLCSRRGEPLAGDRGHAGRARDRAPGLGRSRSRPGAAGRSRGPAGGDVRKARAEANEVAGKLARAEALKVGIASAEARARQAVATGTSIDVSKLDPDAARQLASYQTGVFEAQRLAPKLVDKSEAEFLSLMAEEVAQGRVPAPRTINIAGPPPQPMTMWEYADGTVVRYKPLGDAERPIAFSVEMKVDPNVPDSGRDSAAFKVERSGLAVPRSDFSALNPYNAATHPEQHKAFDNVVMQLAHHGLTR